MSVEFSRPLRLDRIGAAGIEVTVTAEPAECAALAARMRLPAIASLTCRFRLRPGPGGSIVAEGRLHAAVAQICVISLDAFPAEVAEDFTVRFVVPGAPIEADLDDLESPDEIAHDGVAIDLGEATAEQLALALPPYPRKPGAELAWDAQDPADDAGPENPFARLASRRERH